MARPATSIQRDLDDDHEALRRLLTTNQPISKALTDYTLLQWHGIYFQQQQGKKKATTLEVYRYTLDHLVKYLGAERKLRTIDRADMDRYGAYCLQKLAVHTIASRHAMLNESDHVHA